MKKLLILAYDFPPYVSVGGLRPVSWAKYLHECDIFPIIVTRQWSNYYGNALDYVAPSESKKTIIETTNAATIIRTPYKPNLGNKILLKYGNKKYRYIRKFITAFYEISQWIFNIGPKSQLYFAAREYLKNNKVDCIIATGEPFILFRYASKLSKKFKTPWIADYRDPWIQSNRSSNKLHKIWNIYNEKRFLKNVSTITTVSVFFEKLISTNVKNKNFYIITNGYEDGINESIENIKQNSKVLNIGFSGTIYKWHPIESFLRTINDFVKSENKIVLNFYGINTESEIKLLIADKFSNLKNCVNIFPKLKNKEYRQEAAKNNAFLLFNDFEILGTKIFDYMAMKQQIILCFSNDDESKALKQTYFPCKNKSDEEVSCSGSLQADLIKETNSGIVVENSQGLYSVLESLYKEFKENGFIACNSTGIEKYSRRLQTKKLADLIKTRLLQ